MYDFKNYEALSNFNYISFKLPITLPLVRSLCNLITFTNLSIIRMDFEIAILC